MAVVFQVADDLNRMTNYIEDLRNMLVGLVALSILGALIFLFLQRRNGRKSSRESRKLVSLFFCIYFSNINILKNWRYFKSTKFRIKMAVSNHLSSEDIPVPHSRSLLNGHFKMNTKLKWNLVDLLAPIELQHHHRYRVISSSSFKMIARLKWRNSEITIQF